MYDATVTHADTPVQAQSSVSTATVEQQVLSERLNNAALIRRLTACEAANEALNIFLQETESAATTSSSASGFSEVSNLLGF